MRSRGIFFLCCFGLTLASLHGDLGIAWADADPGCLLAPPDSSADLPDDGYFDANDDGIDGMRCGPIFVAPTGSDAKIGTIDSPMRTIGAAILAARAHSPTRDVYIAQGIYDETVVLAEGVNLYGGYDADSAWARSLASRATIRVGPGRGDAAMLAVQIGQPTLVDHLVLVAARDPDGTVLGNANAAALLRDCTAGITFRNTVLQASAGTHGLDGADGAAGAAGGPGGNGGCSFCTPDNIGYCGGSFGLGGDGNNNRGGHGSGSPYWGPEEGRGPSGGFAGMGGGYRQPGGPGGPGGPGLPGDNGQGGGSFAAWGIAGNPGGIGSGGGGGGSGGSSGPFVDAVPGGGGGGGGGGGAGGMAGQGGGAGGSSYCLIVHRAPAEFVRCELATHAGANGGAGGAGGLGGTGALGGLGGVPYGGIILGRCVPSPFAGVGGDGGPGAIGGPGGHGGGGGGGNSIGILHLIGGSSSVDSATTFTTGTPGSGGASLGNPGADGIAANIYDADLDSIPIRPTCTPCCPPAAVHARLVVPRGESQASAEIVIAADNGLEPAASATVVSNPAHGSASATGNVISYTAEPTFFGTDVFEFQACRACGPCAAGFAVVFVHPPTTDASDEAVAKAFSFALSGSNPIRGRTSFRYSLPASVPVKMDVYSVAGRRVATLVDRIEGPGTYHVAFDLTSAAGRNLAPGVYLVRITAGHEEGHVRVIALE